MSGGETTMLKENKKFKVKCKKIIIKDYYYNKLMNLSKKKKLTNDF